MANQLLEKMNPQQKEAITTTEGPLLIMAGAGSGKTRVLTHRIAYLMSEKQVSPWRILAITFTNKAANEMKERLVQLVGDQAESMWIATFHSMCVRILRREASAIGFERSFSIADSSEQQTLMKRIIKSLNLDPKKFDYRMILNHISQAKNNLETPKTYRELHDNFLGKVISDCYDRYQKELKKSQTMDFDDLIFNAVKLFEENDDILMTYQEKFQYIHVDEYQDTNHAQYRLIKLLGKGLRNVCVVGDADQSIYGWRGADISNIMNFESDYPETKVIMLEQNYRSTKKILAAANNVIEKNHGRKPKKLWTDKEEGVPITLYVAQSETDEARFMISKITEAEQKGVSLNDIAILYRTNAQSRSFEDALMRSSINYRLVGGQRFFDRREIRDILAYLKLLVNPADDISFNRAVNIPKRGVGPASMAKFTQFATQEDLPLLAAAQQIALAPITGKAARGIDDFRKLMNDLTTMSQATSLKDLLQTTIEMSGYEDMLKSEATLEAESRLENLSELLSAAEQFEKEADETDETPILVQFLTDLALVTDTNDTEEESDEALTLMTLHAAKGLEFPIVFLVGMEEGIFPLSRAMQSEDELEEERRLAYVGITRAERELYLTRASSRLLYGKHQFNRPSRFIEEIDPSLLKEESPLNSFDRGSSKMGQKQSNGHYQRAFKPAYQTKQHKGVQKVGALKSHDSDDIAVFKIGDHVSHKKWGIGTVVAVKGDGNDQQLDIAFPKIGIKRLLAAFAPIEKAN